MMIDIAGADGKKYRVEGVHVPSPRGFERFFLVAHNNVEWETLRPNEREWAVSIADIGFRFKDTFPTMDDAIADAYKVLRYQGARRMAEFHAQAIEKLELRGIQYPVNEVPKLKESLQWNG